MDKIAVLIPCYNESKTIEKVVTDFKKVLPEAVIYVYDNNSTDHTDEIARRAGAVVRYEYQQGKGNVIRRMFREIDAQCYIMADGDDTYPAEFAPSMVEKVLNKKVDLGTFETEEEAKKGLIDGKIQYINDLAEKCKGKVPDCVYQGMKDWNMAAAS